MIKPGVGRRPRPRVQEAPARAALCLSYGFLGLRLCFLRATRFLLFIRPTRRITKSLAIMDSS